MDYRDMPALLPRGASGTGELRIAATQHSGSIFKRIAVRLRDPIFVLLRNVLSNHVELYEVACVVSRYCFREGCVTMGASEKPTC